MKKALLATALILPFATHANTTLFSFGESTSIVTTNQNILDTDGTNASNTDINRAFSTNLMSPSSLDYTGPDFFGGWETSGGLANDFDFGPLLLNENTGNSNGLDNTDTIFFSPNATAGVAGSLSFLLMGSVASTALDDLTGVTLRAARTTGSGNSATARAVVRVGSSFYISNSTNVTSGYSDLSLDTGSWRTYDPSSSISNIGSGTSLEASSQIDAIGFLLSRSVASTNTVENARVFVSQFEVTAVPEPSNYALISGALALACMIVRRRR